MEPGTKVKCIDDSIKTGKLSFVGDAYKHWIVKDKVYTVREFLNNDDIVPGILLKEVRNPEIYITLLGRDQEPAFGLHRFRELLPAEYLEEEEEYEEIETQIITIIIKI